MKLCGFEAGLDKPFFLIAGPCIIEGEAMLLDIAEKLKAMTEELKIPFILKTSFSKANRTSHKSFSGLPFDQCLKFLEKTRKEVGVPILTDVHEDTPMDEVADVVDVIQTAAFLCRQTNYIQRAARCGLPMNVKKGQFLAPWDMKNVVEKIRAAGNDKILVCERGVSFGYNTLVNDMRSLVIMRDTSCPVVFDATHSVQQPGGQGTSTGGKREFVPTLAKAAVAVGVSGIFMETHQDPDKALSDGPNMWPLHKMKELLKVLVDLDRVVKKVSY